MNAIHLEGLSCRTSTVVVDADGGRTRIFEVTNPRPFTPAKCLRATCTADAPPKPATHVNEFRIVDTPAFGLRSRWTILRPTSRCSCGNLMVQPLPRYVDKVFGMTARCRIYIQRQAALRPFAQVAAEVGVAESTVRAVFRLVDDRVSRPPAPRFLGVDEIHLPDRWNGEAPQERRSEPRVVFTDLETGMLIDLLETGTVDDWLSQLEDRSRIRAVAMDYKLSYRKAVRQLLPQATVVIDRFHVEREIHKALDQVRVAELKEKRVQTVKSARFGSDQIRTLKAWLWSAERPKNHAGFDEYLANYPQTARAYDAKQAFKAIWANSRNAEEARRLFAAWERDLSADIRQHFGSVVHRIQKNAEPVFAFFDFPITNAATEGANSRMRRILAHGGPMKIETLRRKMLARTRVALRHSFFCDGCRRRTDESSKNTSDCLTVGDRLVFRYDGFWLCPTCKQQADLVDPKTWPSSRVVKIVQPKPLKPATTLGEVAATAPERAEQLSLPLPPQEHRRRDADGRRRAPERR